MVLHRPITAMYADNQRYGSSLMHAPGDIERNYRNTLAKTNLRSDRRDLGLHTFTGSHLHGGTPPADRGSMPKTTGPRSTTQNLYEPVVTGYGPGYYDHLRATSPEPRKRVPKTLPGDYVDDIGLPSSKLRDLDFEYKTLPTKIYSDIDNGAKTTTKKTTITEHWVPLTTHIYSTPYHTYYYKSSPFSSYTYRTADDLYSYDYLDDYKRYSKTTTTTKTRNVDALDLSTTTKSNFDYKHYSEKCHEIQSQLDQVNKWVSDAESKIKNEVVTSRNKMQVDLAEVALIVEDTAKYNDELYRAIKKQSKQISDLNSQYDHLNRNISDVVDMLEKSRQRCQTLQSDISSVKSVMEQTYKYYRM
ncbi:uncharacterized protein LOC129231138 [Uloborus diversus]|uniref:uncharacterized protein LOC129231138 n=1 Tax=Uloborus diversus TaxID=327109 RepID=UPI002409B2E9|nr:uncharacterized protein LOC129231138 [Uloborus diversus]